MGPGKSRCVLSVYNCQTDKTDVYPSGARDSGTVSLDCSDYERAVEALGSIAICCDPKCEQPTPWFDGRGGRPLDEKCKDRQHFKILFDGKGFVFLYMCGFPVFVHDMKTTDRGLLSSYRVLLGSHVNQQVGSTVCCDSFKASARPGSSCDPRFDLDCDGTSNGTDRTEDGAFPDITTFGVGPEIPVKDTDPLPSCFYPPDPNRCDCKWELMQGTRTRSRGYQPQDHYEGSWRCPSTGQKYVTSHTVRAREPCGRWSGG